MLSAKYAPTSVVSLSLGSGGGPGATSATGNFSIYLRRIKQKTRCQRLHYQGQHILLRQDVGGEYGFGGNVHWDGDTQKCQTKPTTLEQSPNYSLLCKALTDYIDKNNNIYTKALTIATNHNSKVLDKGSI